MQTVGFVLLREAVSIFTGPRGIKGRQRSSHMHGTFLHTDDINEVPGASL